MVSLCCSLGGVEVRHERFSLFPPVDSTFVDAVSPTVPDDLEGEGSWRQLTLGTFLSGGTGNCTGISFIKCWEIDNAN